MIINPGIGSEEKKDGGVGQSMAGQVVEPTQGSTVTAGEGAEIFNDYSARRYDADGKPTQGNVASGTRSHAEGCCTTASGQNSHAEGYAGIASGSASHVEGASTEASGNQSHAEGISTIASGYSSHAEGNHGIASGSCSHVEGGFYTPAEGQDPVYNEATQYAAHAEGSSTKATGNASHAEGGLCVASGVRSHAEGYNTVASGENSHAEGSITEASGKYSHVEGYHTTANGPKAHAEGSGTIAKNSCDHVEGAGTIAGNDGSEISNSANHAEGYCTEATGDIGSHSEGVETKASGQSSHAEGAYSKASGTRSHAGGSSAIASGLVSFAHGEGVIASANYQTAFGRYNVEKSNDIASLVVGNGTQSTTRTNIFRATSGGVFSNGNYNSTGADYAELFEWTDGNPDCEDRAGRFVTLEGERIRLAGPDDDFILGIVSGNPSVVGDVHDDQWQGMYLYDIFGRPLWEDVEVPEETMEFPDPEDPEKTVPMVVTPAHTERRQKLNPAYDSSQPYQPRTQRPEWDAVGMLGKLVAVDDGTCQADGWCTVGAGGVATRSEARTRFRVMARLDERHVRVLAL